MKNIQVIDGAANTAYSIFAVTDAVFKKLFPSPRQDVEFAEDAVKRLGPEAGVVFSSIWKRKVSKPAARGLHGTLFFELQDKKEFYPRKRESDLANLRFIDGRFSLKK
jgi:hypothetical protein